MLKTYLVGLTTNLKLWSESAEVLGKMEQKEIKIMAVGDISPGDHYFSMGHGVRSSFERNGHKFIFEKVKGLLQQADIAFCNLEGVISDVELKPESFESFAFRGSPEMAEGLKEAGFNIVNIANNHIMQHGVNAFNETISALKKVGIKPLGINIEDNTFSSSPIIIDSNGIKAGFLGYSLVKEAYSPDYVPYSVGQADAIRKDIRELSQVVDFVLVSCHFGTEAMKNPSKAEVRFAHGLIEAGANVFIGHHPHVFQPIERYGKGIILYSLGNFIFDLFWDERFAHSGIVEIRLSTKKKPEVKIYPVSINKLCQPELIAGSMVNAEVEFDLGSMGANYEPFYYDAKARRINRYLNMKKLLYFINHLPLGKTRLKVSFLLRKVVSLLGVSTNRRVARDRS